MKSCPPINFLSVTPIASLFGVGVVPEKCGRLSGLYLISYIVLDVAASVVGVDISPECSGNNTQYKYLQ